MSGKGWASGVILALSTVVSPVTPVAPPLPRPTWSQPGPAGAQLTAGGEGSSPLLASTGEGIVRGSPARMAAALARSRAVIFTVDVAGVADCVPAPRASDLVDGVGYGPASSEQPAVAQPVAAGPVKVGE